MPDDAILFLSSSMPIRWAETYLESWAKPRRVLSNRGVNGIDGVTSTAFGAAAGSGRPVLLITGDIAFIHDAGGLFAARHARRPVVILVLDNDGGGIFSHLPIARFSDLCERLFSTPHGLSVPAIAGGFGLPADRIEDPSAVGEAVRAAFVRGESRVIAFPADRGEVARMHEDAMARVRAAVGEVVSHGV